MSVLAHRMLMAARRPPSVTPSISYIGAVTGTMAASQTISSANIGAADGNRLVVVAVFSWYNGATTGLTGVTIGGVSATLLPCNFNTSGQTGVGGIAFAMVPSGTTANIGLTFSASLGYNVEVAVWRLIVNSPTPVDTDSVSGATATQSLTLSGGAVGVFQACGGGAQNLSSSVNITQDARLIPAISRPSYVGRVNAPASAFSLTMSNATAYRLIGASWS